MIRQLAVASVVVGTLDIAEVMLFYLARGVPPIRVLQGVATGLFGRSSFQGGVRTALVGLALHFLIATAVVCVYHLASRTLPPLRTMPLASGIAYGLLVYAFMNAVVLPLSAAGPPKLTWPVVLNGLFAHVVCVGIPTALLARARGGPVGR